MTWLRPLLLNLLLPGVGSLSAGKTKTAVIQLALAIAGLCGAVRLAVIGIPMADEGDFRAFTNVELLLVFGPMALIAAAWISGVVTALSLRAEKSAPEEPEAA